MRYNKKTNFYNNSRKRSEGEEGIGPNRKYFRDDNRRRAQEIVSPDNNSLIGRFLQPKHSKDKRAEDFTREEKSAILARVRSVGIAQTAFEAGIKKRIIVKWFEEIDRFEQKKTSKFKPYNSNVIKQKTKQTPEAENASVTSVPTEKQEQNIEIEVNKPQVIEETEKTVEEIEEIVKESKENTEQEIVLQKEPDSGPEFETKEEIKPQKTIKKKTKMIHISPVEVENNILKNKIANLQKQIEELRAEILLRTSV